MENHPPANPRNNSTPEVPEAAPSRRRPGRALAFVAAGAIGATAISGIAFAATSAPSPSADSSASGAPANPDADGGMGRGPHGDGDHDGDRGRGPGMRGGPEGPMRGGPGGPMRGFGGPVLHGEAVVTKEDGTTATMRVQKGQVTAVSATEITITSSDGFEQTWPLTADTKISRDRADATASDIAVGDTAMAVGEVTGGTVTTKRVGVLSPAEAKAMEQRRAQRHSGDAPSASPTPTS